MQTLKKTALILTSILAISSHSVFALTDQEAQEKFLKARVESHQDAIDHSAHHAEKDSSQEFHGVFYGFIPCKDCNGIKTTLSLKQNNNYLLVTQPARESSREFYEKGKYVWDDENHTVTLTPKNDAVSHAYFIKDEGGTLVHLVNGKQVTGEDAERYFLRRSDTVKSREVHIH